MNAAQILSDGQIWPVLCRGGVGVKIISIGKDYPVLGLLHNIVFFQLHYPHICIPLQAIYSSTAV